MAAQHIRFVHMLNEKQSAYRDSPTWWTCWLFEKMLNLFALLTVNKKYPSLHYSFKAFPRINYLPRTTLFSL